MSTSFTSAHLLDFGVIAERLAAGPESCLVADLQEALDAAYQQGLKDGRQAIRALDTELSESIVDIPAEVRENSRSALFDSLDAMAEEPGTDTRREHADQQSTEWNSFATEMHPRKQLAVTAYHVLPKLRHIAVTGHVIEDAEDRSTWRVGDAVRVEASDQEPQDSVIIGVELGASAARDAQKGLLTFLLPLTAAVQAALASGSAVVSAQQRTIL